MLLAGYGSDELCGDALLALAMGDTATDSELWCGNILMTVLERTRIRQFGRTRRLDIVSLQILERFLRHAEPIQIVIGIPERCAFTNE